MPYAILRFEKRKGGPASALEKHHERKKEQYASNPDIDLSRSHLNYHLVTPRQKYYAEIQSRIEKAQRENPKCKVRKDSIKFIDTIVTATPEFLAEMSLEEVQGYFQRALEFLEREVGKENIFSAVVHMDERNPHMHLCFVPLTKDNRLSAKEVMGNRNKLIEWQDKFHDYMAEEFPELERGQAAAVTKRKHIPTWLYKQAHRLSEEMEQIRQEVQSIGVLNAGKQREKVLKLLLDWYPKVNAFEAKLRPYDEQLRLLKEQELSLRQDAERTKKYRDAEHQENLSLLDELWGYRDFIDSIPQEVMEELQQGYKIDGIEQKM
jgi:hypothetical protein